MKSILPLRVAVAALLTLLAGIHAARADAVLVPAGATWRYLDTGTDPGVSWTAAAFPDSGWPSGPAELGYGDAGEGRPEATVVSYGPNSSSKYITTYFRHRFQVADPSAFASLDLRVLRDDGVVVHLNGTEVFRNNLPSGPVGYQTPASTAIGGSDESTFLAAAVPASLLVAGENILAVEMHQSGGTSSDLSFDLSLTGLSPGSASIVRGPYLQKAGADRITVRWRTSVPTDSRVRFGTEPGNLDRTVSEPALVTEHAVELAGLAPATRHHYAIGNSSGDLRGGADCYFYTAPATGTVQPLRFWILGDAGTGTSGQASVRDAYASFSGNRYTDLILMLGDNAYDNGTDAEYQAKVFNVYPGILPSTPVFSTIGNHDTASQSNPNIATTPYFSIFDHPVQGDLGGVASGTEKYYSFNYGNVHFVCLDSMTSDRSVSGPMLSWLQADLAQNTADWLIAFFHHPPYTKGSHDSDTESNLVQMRANALPILEAHGVDLVLCGHSHSYERSYLLNGHYGTSGTLAASMVLDGGDGREGGDGAYQKPLPGAGEGAVYVVPGSAGKISGGTLNHPAMFYSLNALGSLVVDVQGGRLDAWFVRETGAVDDHFTLLKGDPGNVPPAVSVTSPVAGAYYASVTPILMTAEAFDADGTVAAVEFVVDGTPVGVGLQVAAGVFQLEVTGIAAGGHSVTAVATDNLGAQGASDPVAFTVTAPVQPPFAPGSLTATATGPTSIRLDWTDGSADEDGFTIEVSADATAWSVAGGVGAGVTTWTDTTLLPGTTRSYRVLAYNAAGSSAPSPVASATTPVPPPFVETAPAADLPVSGSVDGTAAALGAADGAVQSLREVESGGKPSSRTSLLEHGWRFDAVPGGLSVTVLARAWAPANGEGDHFVFESSVDGGATWSVLFTVAAGSDPSNAPGAVLPAGTRGEVRIRVRDTDRTAGRRQLDTLVVDRLVIRTDLDPTDAPPAAPGSVSAAAVSPTSVQVSWVDASDNERGFAIERAAAGGGFVPLMSVGAGSGSYLDTAAAPATAYRYRVRAFTTSYESAWVESGEVVTPDGLALSASGTKQKGFAIANLTWSGGSTLPSVRVWRRINGGAWELRATVSNTGAFTDSTGLKGSFTAEYRVGAVDGSVESNVAAVVF